MQNQALSSEVNITIPVFNRAELIQRTLPELRRNTRISCQIVVVNNGSDDETRTYLDSLQRKGTIDSLFHLDRNYGVACAVNVGWQLVKAQHYMKLDSDMLVLVPGWLERIFAMWHQVERPSLMGPLWSEQFALRSAGTVQTDAGPVHKASATLPGCATLVPDSIVSTLGYWSEDYGLYGEEDADYCIRAHYAGVPMYCYEADGVLEDLQPMATSGLERERKAHLNTLNIGTKDQYGIYKANEYLFGAGIRPPKVELKYEILGNKAGEVTLGVSKSYLDFRKRLSAVVREINKVIAQGSRDALAHPDMIAKIRDQLYPAPADQS